MFGKWELLRDVWATSRPGAPAASTPTPAGCAGSWPLAGAPDLVANVRGVGYRLSLTPIAAPDAHELAATALTGSGRAA